MTDVRTPEMYLHEGTIGSDGKHCDSARCWCWDEFAATVEARTLDKRCPECDNGQYCGIGPCPKCHPEAYVTSKERNLPALLRAAERRVNDFVLLLCEAADEIERLSAESKKWFLEWSALSQNDGKLEREIDRLTRENERYAAWAREYNDSVAADRLALVEVRGERDRLRAALQQARTLLCSDSVEYDDLRNLNQILDAALSGEPAFAVETFCECPPNCQGPDHTSKLCRAESSEKRQETRNDES